MPISTTPGNVPLAASLILLLIATRTNATTLVKDITVVGDPSAGLLHSGLVLVDGLLVFTGDDGLTGREIWTSDGTAAGTERLGDLVLSPSNYVEMGGDLYFTSTGADSGCEVWVADLTTGVATELTDQNTPGSLGCPTTLVATSSHVYFVSSGSNVVDAVGREIWRTDGTVGGETVHELVLGPDDGALSSLTPVGDDLYFVGDDGLTGSELWRVTDDGLVQRIDAVDDGAGPVVETHSTPTGLYAINDNVIAFTAMGSDGRELFRFNGTDTLQVADIRTGSASSFPDDLYRFGARTYLSADDGVHGREAWSTDGTSATRLSDVHVGGDSDPQHFVGVGSTVYFFATDGTEVDLWSTGGTLASTAKVRDLPGLDLIEIEVHGAASQFFFFHDTGSGPEPVELWRSDGTDPGTVLLGTFENYWRNASVVIGDTLYFSGTTAADGRELWASDGTVAGTVQITDHADPSSDPDDLHALGDLVFFTAYEPATGRELWGTDGSEAGTVLRFDGDPAGNGFSSLRGAASHGYLYFTAEDPSLGEELFRIDASGHSLAFDLVPGAEDSSPGDFYGTPDRLYFSAYDEQGDGLYELRSTDGASVVRLDPNPDGDDDAYDLHHFDGVTYFSCYTEFDGRELFTTDGTAAGTALVADIDPTGSSSPEDFGSGLGLLFFSADDADGREPWVSDGTSSGTVQLLDVRPGPDSSSPEGFVEANGVVFFTARNGSGIESLFVTDGSGPGTLQILEDVDGVLVAVPGGVVFARDHPSLGRELYFSDGSTAQLLVDIRPGALSASPTRLTSFDGIAYFAADDGAHGEELWKSDGTVAGTRLIDDVHPGPRGSAPQELTGADSRLYFTANDGITGRELHAIELPLFADGFETADTDAWSLTL